MCPYEVQFSAKRQELKPKPRSQRAIGQVPDISTSFRSAAVCHLFCIVRRYTNRCLSKLRPPRRQEGTRPEPALTTHGGYGRNTTGGWLADDPRVAPLRRLYAGFGVQERVLNSTCGARRWVWCAGVWCAGARFKLYLRRNTTTERLLGLPRGGAGFRAAKH
jgi:hypothetical protein